MNTAAIRQAVQFLTSWLAYHFAQTTLPGMAIAVSHKNTIIFSKAYGLADTVGRQLLKPSHLFGVASQSKMLAATAVMQLCQQGKLALDAPICTYLPWFAGHPYPHAQEVTIRQLLSHSAGFARDLPDADFWIFARSFPDRLSLQRAILRTPVLVTPNTQLKYSNAGFGLVGLVIEAASGQSYDNYIRQRIIQPLGLKHTYPDYNDDLVGQTVAGYGVPFRGKRPAFAVPRHATNALAPAAGALSTAEDMCRFAQAHYPDNSLLLSNVSQKEMQRTQWSQPDGYDAGQAFGLGLEISEMGDWRVVGHGGHIAGHLTATFFSPQHSLAVAVMANSKDAPSMRIASGIFEVLSFFANFGARPVPAVLARFNGRFHNPIGAVQIIATAEKIIAIDPDDWEPFAFQEELERVTDTALRIVTPGSIFNTAEKIEYTINNNHVSHIRYTGGTLWPEKLYRARFGI